LEPLELAGGVLRVRAQNHAQVRYLDQHCGAVLAEGAQAATGRLVSLAFETDEPESGGAAGLSFEGNGELRLQPDYVFENFITGPCNRLAHAAAWAVGESPGRAYNPLFVHGLTGLGKSHLLQAICHAIKAKQPRLRVSYISCGLFSDHFWEAVERGALNQFRHRYRHVDVLVIDDISMLAEKERSQEEFFHTFNALHQSQRQIVLSADCPPGGIPSLQDRLVSRFNSGLVAEMEPPCLETRMAILRNKARLRCVGIPEDVVQFVAGRVISNIRELEGAIMKLDALSQARGGRIDMDCAHLALTGQVPQRLSIESIVDVVIEKFSVKRSELLGKGRPKSVVEPRHICMYLARELTSLTLQEIGGYFGGRDHSTVVHAVQAATNRRAGNPQFNELIESLLAQLRRRAQTVE